MLAGPARAVSAGRRGADDRFCAEVNGAMAGRKVPPISSMSAVAAPTMRSPVRTSPASMNGLASGRSAQAMVNVSTQSITPRPFRRNRSSHPTRWAGRRLRRGNGDRRRRRGDGDRIR